MKQDLEDAISHVYATGSVSCPDPCAGSVGGLIGFDNSTDQNIISHAFWNTETSGQATSDGGVGKTSAEFKQLATFAGWDIDAEGGTGAIWRIYEGHTNPLLRDFLTPLTVQATAEKTYDGQGWSADGDGSFTVDYTGFKPGDSAASLLGTLSDASGAVDAGSHTLDLTGLYTGQQGYDISYANGTLTIDRKTLTVAGGAVETTRVYDGTVTATVTDSGNLTGVISGDATDLLLFATYANENVGIDKTVSGHYVITGTDARNYRLADAGFSASADITPATLTAADGAVQASRVYNGGVEAVVTANGSLDGVFGADDVTLSLTGTEYADKNVGTDKTVSGQYVISGTDAGNYRLDDTGFSASADITQATLSAAGGAVQASRIYDGGVEAVVTDNGTLGGTVFGTDNVTLSLTGTEYADKNVGTGKAVSGHYLISGADAGNYRLADAGFSASADITPATLTAAGGAVQASRVYDGGVESMVTADGTLGGVLGTDDVSLSLTGTEYTDKNVGTDKTVSGHYVISGADAGNYRLADAGFQGAADITPLSITVSADDLSKIFGQPDPRLTWHIDGLAEGDSAGDVLSGTLRRDPGEEMGVYRIGRGDLSAHVNYHMEFFAGQFHIDTARIETLLGERAAGYRAALSSTPSDEQPTSNSRTMSVSLNGSSAARHEAPYTIENGGMRLPEAH